SNSGATPDATHAPHQALPLSPSISRSLSRRPSRSLPELVGTRANRLPALASAVAYAGAAAFLVAAVWYALVVAEVTVASEPRPQPGEAQEEWFHVYYAWFASTLRQERYYTSAAIVGFLSLMVTAAFVRNA